MFCHHQTVAKHLLNHGWESTSDLCPSLRFMHMQHKSWQVSLTFIFHTIHFCTTGIISVKNVFNVHTFCLQNLNLDRLVFRNLIGIIRYKFCLIHNVSRFQRMEVNDNFEKCTKQKSILSSVNDLAYFFLISIHSRDLISDC